MQVITRCWGYALSGWASEVTAGRPRPDGDEPGRQQRHTHEKQTNPNLIISKGDPCHSLMEACLQIADRREDYHRQNKEKRRNITNDTAAVKISSRLEILTYMCISICKHKPPTHTHTDVNTPLEKVRICAHTQHNPSNQRCQESCQASTKRNTFIYLFTGVQSNYRHYCGARLWRLFRKSGSRRAKRRHAREEMWLFSSSNL